MLRSLRRTFSSTLGNARGVPVFKTGTSGVELLLGTDQPLHSFKGPTASLWGPCRVGKSTRASLLSGRGSGVFEVSDSFAGAKTLGIDGCLGVDPLGSGRQLAILDTEGTSLARDEEGRVRVQQLLACAYLTSSIVIWCDHNVFANSCTDVLRLVSEFAAEKIELPLGSTRPMLLYLKIGETRTDRGRYRKYSGADTFDKVFQAILQKELAGSELDMLTKAFSSLHGLSLPDWTEEDEEAAGSGTFWQGHKSAYKKGMLALASTVYDASIPEPILHLHEIGECIGAIRELKSFDPHSQRREALRILVEHHFAKFRLKTDCTKAFHDAALEFGSEEAVDMEFARASGAVFKDLPACRGLDSVPAYIQAGMVRDQLKGLLRSTKIRFEVKLRRDFGGWLAMDPVELCNEYNANRGTLEEEAKHKLDQICKELGIEHDQIPGFQSSNYELLMEKKKKAGQFCEASSRLMDLGASFHPAQCNVALDLARFNMNLQSLRTRIESVIESQVEREAQDIGESIDIIKKLPGYLKSLAQAAQQCCDDVRKQKAYLPLMTERAHRFGVWLSALGAFGAAARAVPLPPAQAVGCVAAAASAVTAGLSHTWSKFGVVRVGSFFIYMGEDYFQIYEAKVSKSGSPYGEYREEGKPPDPASTTWQEWLNKEVK